jgi:phage terminase small subunit
MADGEGKALTEQQERFCQAIVAGMNQTDAYKAAGYKGAYKSMKDNAARLIANDSVAQRIAELRKPIAAKAAVTLAWLIEQAQEVLAAAKSDSAHAASIAAIKELGILSGERVETRHNLNQDTNEPSDLSRADLLDIARAGRKGVAASGDGAGKPDRVHKVH